MTDNKVDGLEDKDIIQPKDSSDIFEELGQDSPFAEKSDGEVKASAESVAKAIADINSFGEGTVMETSAVESKKKTKKSKQNKNPYHVSNFDILKNFKSYSSDERKHYRYVFFRRIGMKVWPIFRFLILFGLCFVVLYPIIYMISVAIRPQIEMSDPSIMWIPKTIRWENFSEAWNAMSYAQAVGNTLSINLVSAVLSVAVCAMTGYGFARFNFKGKKLLFGIVILQIIVPIQIIIMPQFSLFRNFDILGIFSALDGAPLTLTDTPMLFYIKAIMGNGIRSGLFILLFRQFFRGLPKELEDAAYLDGCGPFQTFTKIMVPNAASSFLTVFIFSIVWYWNDYYESSMFLQNTITVSMKVSLMGTEFPLELLPTGMGGGPVSVLVWMQAGCILAIIPIILMYIFLQKHFTEGIERSGFAN